MSEVPLWLVGGSKPVEEDRDQARGQCPTQDETPPHYPCLENNDVLCRKFQALLCRSKSPFPQQGWTAHSRWLVGFRALSGRLKSTVRRHQFNTDSLLFYLVGGSKPVEEDCDQTR